MKRRFLFFIGIILLSGSIAYSDGQDPNSGPRLGRCFLYTAKKLGVSILKATISIDNGPMEPGRTLYQVHVNVESLQSMGLLFQMKNRFTSIIEGETCSPVRYMKEIDQGGLLFREKKYIQTLAFDNSTQKVVVEKKGEDGREEIPLPPGTCDPLSIFARYYLRDEFHPGQDIQLSLFDGMKLRQMIFHSKKEKVKTKLYGEVEAICVESTSSFSTFGDQEGMIRIWYLTNGEKIPISMELDLPIGSVTFELEEVKKNKRESE
jgi:hypothetical protein